MDNTLVQWITDETLLQQAVDDLSILALLGIVVVCIVLLSKGADWMIDGVVDLARRTGLPKIVIGATVVSLGTTLPEAFESVMAGSKCAGSVGIRPDAFSLTPSAVQPDAFRRLQPPSAAFSGWRG